MTDETATYRQGEEDSRCDGCGRRSPDHAPDCPDITRAERDRVDGLVGDQAVMTGRLLSRLRRWLPEGRSCAVEISRDGRSMDVLLFRELGGPLRVTAHLNKCGDLIGPPKEIAAALRRKIAKMGEKEED